MGVVTTSLVVSLGDDAGADSIYSAQVDDREKGLNGGKTSFNPGDYIYILLFRTDNVTTLNAIASKGSLVRKGTSQFEVEGFATFANESEYSLNEPVPAGASLTTQWLGNNLGAFTIQNQSKIVLSSNVATLGDPFVGVMKYSYTSVADVYLLQNTLIPDITPYEILCYWAGEVA